MFTTAIAFIVKYKSILKYILFLGVIIGILFYTYNRGYDSAVLDNQLSKYEALEKEVIAKQALQTKLDEQGQESADKLNKLQRENQLLLDKRKYETPKDPVCSDRKLSPERVQYLQRV